MEPRAAHQREHYLMLGERMASLETAQGYDRAIINGRLNEALARIAWLERQRLEGLPLSQTSIGWDGWIKIGIMLLMPIVVFGLGNAVTVVGRLVVPH